jgi:hypothetical protein
MEGRKLAYAKRQTAVAKHSRHPMLVSALALIIIAIVATRMRKEHAFRDPKSKAVDAVNTYVSLPPHPLLAY